MIYNHVDDEMVIIFNSEDDDIVYEDDDTVYEEDDELYDDLVMFDNADIFNPDIIRKNSIKKLLDSVDSLDSEDLINITKILRKAKLSRIIDE